MKILNYEQIREKLIEYYTPKWGKKAVEQFIEDTNPTTDFAKFVLEAQARETSAEIISFLFEGCPHSLDKDFKERPRHVCPHCMKELKKRFGAEGLNENRN